MDILYYSNYCKNSQNILQILGKTKLVNELSFINIDKREHDPKNNNIYILLEDGKKVILPPNIHSVPTLLLVSNKYNIIYGDDILKHYHHLLIPVVSKQTPNIEPSGFALDSFNTISENYTNYNLTADELSCKGNSEKRPLHNFVSVKQNIMHIDTPDETYKPDKVSSDVTLDSLRQTRLNEIEKY